MNKDFWMPKASSESDIAHNNPSRSDLKRSQQWFMEGSESEIFPNKKQALEVPNPNSYTALLNSNLSSWGNSSNFHSQLFDDESPSISYSGIRKVKVNQVKESEGFYGKINDASITMGLSFDRTNDSIISMADTFNRGDNNFMSMGEGHSCQLVTRKSHDLLNIYIVVKLVRVESFHTLKEPTRTVTRFCV